MDTIALPTPRRIDQDIKPFARSRHTNVTVAGFDGTSDAFDVYRILNEHRKECEVSGDYVAARLTRKRLNGMRSSQHDQFKENMMQRHDDALETLRQEQHEVLGLLNEKWNEKELPVHKANRQRLIEDLHERQQVELTQFQGQLSAQVVKPKYPPEILNLKRRMQVLGIQGRYNAAQKLQNQINKLVAEFEKKHKESITERYDRLCRIFVAKQKKEFDALKLKLDIQKNAKIAEKHRELGLLGRRQKKEMCSLLLSHGLEKAKSKLPSLLTPR